MFTPEPRVDVEQVMQQIRERARSGRVPVMNDAGMAMGDVPEADADFHELRRLIEHARRCSARIGEQPPKPPTLRARLCSGLVRLVRRMLFWYTPQITDCNDATLRALDEQVAALENLSTRFNARLAILEQRMAEANRESNTDAPRS